MRRCIFTSTHFFTGNVIPFIVSIRCHTDEGLDLVPYIGGDIYKMLRYPVG